MIDTPALDNFRRSGLALLEKEREGETGGRVEFTGYQMRLILAEINMIANVAGEAIEAANAAILGDTRPHIQQVRVSHGYASRALLHLRWTR